MLLMYRRGYLRRIVALSGGWNLRLSRVKLGKLFMTVQKRLVIASFSSIMVPKLVDHFNLARPNHLLHFLCTAADTEASNKELYLQNPCNFTHKFSIRSNTLTGMAIHSTVTTSATATAIAIILSSREENILWHRNKYYI
jgi:hypothetical protein